MRVAVQHAENQGVRIAYEVRGDGPTLLLMQGLGYARWGWGPLTSLLADRFTVLAYDNRGIGESDVPAGPYTTDDLARDAAAVLDSADVERAHVVGASLGGMAAQELALAWPERVDRLVLACATPGGPDVHPLPEPTLRLMQEAPALPPEVALRRFVENALSAEASTELADEIYGLRLANPPDPIGWQGQAEAATTFAAYDRLHGLASPTLVLQGSADAVVDPRNASLLGDRIPDARVEVLDGLGHLFFWEDPRRTARLITEFLEATA
jgi:3-oxoadipate enol-lactonase